MTTIISGKNDDDDLIGQQPLILLLLDGFAVAPENEGNLFSLVKTPTIANLSEDYPVLLLKSLKGSTNQKYLSLGTGVEKSEEDLNYKGEFVSLSSTLSENSIKQLKIFESNRFAALTYFFNGLREEKLPFEEWRIITSSLKNGEQLDHSLVTKKIFSELMKELDSDNIASFITVSIPSIDLAARAGDLEKTKNEIVLVDKLLTKLVDKVINKNYRLIITSVFGNAEKMLDLSMETSNNEPTKNPLPVIFVGQDFKGLSAGKNDVLDGDLSSLLVSGSLSDLASIILEILNLKKPQSMPGKNLIDNLI